jgi:two-component system response regulator
MNFDGEKILLVDDNPKDVELTMLALRESKIANQIVVARDGPEALDYLFGTGTFGSRDTEDRPAVVLLDIKMPKLDGLEVLRRIRADPRTRRIPVVLLTSSTEEQDKATGYDLGANSFVRKPVDFTNFVSAVRDLGVYWLLRNEAPPGP